MGWQAREPTAEEQALANAFAPPKPETANYSQLDIAAAAFRKENLLSTYIANRSAEFPVEPDYEPFSTLDDKYMNYWEAFSGSGSEAETESIKARVDNGINDMRAIHGSGASGILWSIAAGSVDPLNMALMLTPLGVAKKGATVAETALTVAGGGVVAAGVTELGLHSLQPTRTKAESGFALGGTALLGGILGGGVGMSAAKRTEAIIAFEKDLTIMKNGGLEELPDSVGAASVTGTLREEGATGPLGPGLNPLIRMMKSGSGRARALASQMFNHNFYLGKNKITNADGSVSYKATEISVETEITRTQNGSVSRYTRSLRENYRDYRQTGGKENFKTFREFVGRAMSTKDLHDIPQVAKVAKDVRKVINEITERLKKTGQLNPAIEANKIRLERQYKKYEMAGGKKPFDVWRKNLETKQRAEGIQVDPDFGVPVGAPSYFPRVYNNKINSVEFEDLLRNYFKDGELGEGEIADISNSIIGNIRGTPAGHLPKNIIPKAGATKERVLDIADVVLEEFLEKDVDLVMQRYLRTVVPELVLIEKFGDVDIAGPVTFIRSEYDVLMEGKTTRQKAKLRKERESVIRDIENSRDIILGNHRPPEDHSKAAVKMVKTARAGAFMASLGGMTISAIPDIGRAVMQHGFKPFAEAIGPALSKWSPKAKMVRAEWRDIGIAAETLTSTRTMAQGDVSDLTGITGKVTGTFVKLTLMDRWNDTMKTMAAFTAQNRFIRDINKYSSLSSRRKERLAKAGFSEEVIGRMRAQLDTHAEKLQTSRVANTQDWTDKEAARLFENALLKDVEVTIVTPGAGDLPTFMSGEIGKTVLQFRSFFLAAHNQVLLPGLQQMARGDSAVYQGLAIMMGLGMLVEISKLHLAGRQDEMEKYTPADWLRVGVDRSGVAAVPMELFNTMDRMSGQLFDESLSGLMGMSEGSRYYNRNLAETLGGPALGFAERLTRAGMTTIDGEPTTQGDIHNARRMIPGQNLFYLRGGFNYLEEQIAEGKPGRRRRSGN